jgi:hypothetical protein
LYGAETWTLQKVDQIWKVLKRGAEEGWRRSVGPIMWEELQRGKEVKNILQTIKKGKANWIGQSFVGTVF